jgi:hypothetical protein
VFVCVCECTPGVMATCKVSTQVWAQMVERDCTLTPTWRAHASTSSIVPACRRCVHPCCMCCITCVFFVLCCMFCVCVCACVVECAFVSCVYVCAYVCVSVLVSLSRCA